LASGRDADIFEFGPKLVLRRSRHGRSSVIEAQTMEYLQAHGYPVPAVEEVSRDGTDLIMERINGPSMLDYLGRRPWTVRQQGRLLGELHARLHQIPPPPFLGPAPVGSGERFVHLDLHPLNVMIGERGPVVIDWTNAARGDEYVDVALAQVLISSAAVPANALEKRLLGLGRSLLLGAFLSRFDRARVNAILEPVVEYKVKDPNMSAGEVARMWQMVEKARGG